MRDIVMHNLTHHCFYLKPLPDAAALDLGWYVDFRRISAVRIGQFIEQKDSRIATLMGDTRNELYQQLMLFFTRCRLFLGSEVTCASCGNTVPIDIKVEDQNSEAEPWV
jgi:hypothetical protein